MERRRLRVTGTVQGVGFRPFVYRQALALGLGGFVANDSLGVVIEVEGPPDRLDELARLVAEDAPPLARVAAVESTPLPLDGAGGAAGGPSFRIVDSRSEGAPAVAVSVDVATCADCLREMDDPADRRFGYPFVNCTNCGPRYTIIRQVPYDRPFTTMSAFPMCADCRREYEDPADRRFHAEPVACPACGPQLRFTAPDGTVLAERGDALARTAAALLGGAVLAVKGLGGYHLAVDATDADAVGELRRRKARDDKPFALMVADLATARSLCELSEAGAADLASPRRPIVLAPRVAGGGVAHGDGPSGAGALPSGGARGWGVRPDSGAKRRVDDGHDVADGVAPGLPELGLMLPYTPLHHLLLRAVGRPLVMTSGNLSDEPIAHDDADARARLGPMVDGILTHDRAIHIRCDDSVVRDVAFERPTVATQMLRRSRGYAPEPLALAAPADRQVLAVGAELKSTVAVAKGANVVASHHIGDLEHLPAYRSFLQAVDHLCHLAGVTPELVAHDLHPEYLSTKYALDLDLPTHGVQHHHAHVASCLAEHGHTGAVLGVAFDGTGLGPDGTLWGGELLVADLRGYRRVGHLLPVPLPGGAQAIREPWRMGLTWARVALGAAEAERFGRAVDERWAAVLSLLDQPRTIMTSSAGRLFDAVAALLGLRPRVTYEAQAAIELEAAAATVPLGPPGPLGAAPAGWEVEVTHGATGAVLDPRPLVARVVAERDRGTPLPEIAAGFHAGLGAATARLAARLARENGVGTVALSGGVFQNARLSRIVVDHLRADGLEVLVHRRVPPNDGGISIGQAAIAAAVRREGGASPFWRQ